MPDRLVTAQTREVPTLRSCFQESGPIALFAVGCNRDMDVVRAHVIETARIILRRFVLADTGALTSAICDAETTRLLPIPECAGS